MKITEKLEHISDMMYMGFGTNPTYSTFIEDGYLVISKTNDGEVFWQVFEEDVEGLSDKDVLQKIIDWIDKGDFVVAIPQKDFLDNKKVLISRINQLM